MNIKKYSLKTMCAALACTTVLSSTLAAYATDVIINETPMDDSAEINAINTLADDSAGTDTGDSGWTTEENSFEDIKVTYQQSSSYAVTIPKTIALGTNKQAAYSVKVSGEIGSDQRVYVAPVDGITDSENLDFYMSDLSGKKADVVATVTQNKTYWGSEDVANAYEETQNCVSAPDLTAGVWEGTFQVEIRLETEKEQEHTHNYVDGKCSCGAIDPNHTHNYVDGTCTICGEKETDPYETAPAEAYSNWNYTLDDTNNTITLNYYAGSEKDVIVYANYVIDGKTYKTQIASYKNDKNFKYDNAVGYMFNGWARPNSTDGGVTGYMTQCRYIKSIKFSKDIDTSNVTDMSYMFNSCDALTDLDISCFDTSNVTNMTAMFNGCEALTDLDISCFDTSKVTNMKSMFGSCNSLRELEVSNFDTSNVTNMEGIFYGCATLTGLDVTGFNTSKVTDMSGMFDHCSALTSLDVTGFDTSMATDMSAMFDYCSSLTSLDLSSFDTSKVTNMNHMFNRASNLTTIYVTEGKWSTAKASQSYMFNYCGTSSVTYK